jgi:hypothetical protein
MKVIQWHKDLMNSLADRFGLSTYQVVWLGFLKGAVIGYLTGVLL